MMRGTVVYPLGRPGWHYVVREAKHRWTCGRCGKVIHEHELYAAPTQGKRPRYCTGCVRP